jgi:hypothetical protein
MLKCFAEANTTLSKEVEAGWNEVINGRRKAWEEYSRTFI